MTAPLGGLRAFPICLAWVPMLCKRTFANRRRGSHQTGALVPTSSGAHSSLSASTRAGLASSAIPSKVKRPYCGRGASGGCWVPLMEGT